MAKARKKKKLTNRQKVLWLLFVVAVAVVAGCMVLSGFDHEPMEELAVAAFGFLSGAFCCYMGVDAVDHASANKRDVELARMKMDDDTEGDEGNV